MPTIKSIDGNEATAAVAHHSDSARFGRLVERASAETHARRAPYEHLARLAVPRKEER